MSLKLGNTDINKGYLGGTEIKKAYLGNTIVFDNTSDTRFITTHNIASNGETLTLPYSGNNETDWGDGTITATGNTHAYTNSGVYTVKIDGVVDDWSYGLNGGDKDKITNINNIGEFLLSEESFSACQNLELCVGGTYKTVPSGYIRNAFNFCPNLRFDSDVVFDFNGSDSTTNSTLQLFNLNNGGNGVNVKVTYTNAVMLNCRSDFRQAKSFNSVVDFSNIPVVGLSQFFESNAAINTLPINLDTSQCATFSRMFLNATAFNKDVSLWDYSSATNISRFMEGKSSTNYDYQYYDNLLIKWDSDPSVGGLDFGKLTNLTVGMGTIQYSSAGASAHASLVTKGLIITDGGQNGF